MTMILGPNGPGEASDTRQMIERERVNDDRGSHAVTNLRFLIALLVIVAAFALGYWLTR